VSGDHRLLESSELSGRKCPLTRLRERDAGEPGAALPTWVVRAGTPPSSQGVPGALVGKDRRCHELPLQDKRRGRIHLDRRGSPPRGAPALRRPRRPPLQREDRVNYRADDPESRENVGLEDLRFGVIGLGTCAGLAILSQSSSSRRARHSPFSRRAAVLPVRVVGEGNKGVDTSHGEGGAVAAPAFAGEDQMAAPLFVRSSSASLIVRSLS
jgi:hypothetical protein